MGKIVSLSVHRNTRDQRRRHDMAYYLRGVMSSAIREKKWDGFALVLIRHDASDDTFITRTRYMAPPHTPTLMLPAMVAEALRDTINENAEPSQDPPGKGA